MQTAVTCLVWRLVKEGTVPLVLDGISKLTSILRLAAGLRFIQYEDKTNRLQQNSTKVEQTITLNKNSKTSLNLLRPVVP